MRRVPRPFLINLTRPLCLAHRSTAVGADVVPHHPPALVIFILRGVGHHQPHWRSLHPAVVLFLVQQPAVQQVSLILLQLAALRPDAAMSHSGRVARPLRPLVEEGGQFAPVTQRPEVRAVTGRGGACQQRRRAGCPLFVFPTEAVDGHEGVARPRLLPAVRPQQRMMPMPVVVVDGGHTAVKRPIVDVANDAGVQSGAQGAVTAVGQSHLRVGAVVAETVQDVSQVQWVAAAVLANHRQQQLIAAWQQVAGGGGLVMGERAVHHEAGVAGRVAHVELRLTPIAPDAGKADADESCPVAQGALNETEGGIVVYMLDLNSPIFRYRLLQGAICGQGRQGLWIGEGVGLHGR